MNSLDHDYLDNDIDILLEESVLGQLYEKCVNHAPYIFFQEVTGRGRILQGCCNDWTCPRCGQIRARQEYGRIVEGAKKIGDKPLYFWTLTCRGRELSLTDAEAGYQKWTNRLLTNCRTKAKREGATWHYVQVTERQQVTRQHPHSHLICSYCPPDAIKYEKGETTPNGRIVKMDILVSQWFKEANISAGLGPECMISLIREPEAVAKYIAKYLFADSMKTKWPKNWRRIRYSQSWPKLPKHENPTAFPLLILADWRRMNNLGVPVVAENDEIYLAALAREMTNVLPPRGSNQTLNRL